ncbi:hypothetical protein G7K_4891-t1 [Saitoella complicata NRRL Y-17804]|uniref:Uncharacterized protein n=1 Tax=Saitoella complicata (strain BCRC 22490 / CBS 7301 / JCM 7358 / NBRC 10748 / NRRL Y-17804) TaxID=698492 RepID=A0A0E9NMX3_SAICN|nr:hypothetical protein G7K_4891-t1 [Saitoella complicata NRRL Y-17804]
MREVQIDPGLHLNRDRRQRTNRSAIFGALSSNSSERRAQADPLTRQASVQLQRMTEDEVFVEWSLEVEMNSRCPDTCRVQASCSEQQLGVRNHRQ